MPGPVFASGAVLNADGTITPVVDASTPRFTAVTEAPEPSAPPTPPAEPAEGDDDETPVPVEPTEPGDEGEEGEGSAEPAAPEPQDLGQHPGESNRRFRARLWEENQNYQRRHAQLLARDTERAQRLAFLEGQLAAIQRGQGAPAEPQGQPTAPQPQGVPGVRARPQPQSYGDYQQYEDDLLTWRDEVRAAEAVARQRAEADRQVQEQWQSRTEEGRLHYPDYDARMAALQVAVGPGSVLAPFFVGSEHGAALMYHLGTHPDELKAFNAMTPYAAAGYLVGLEARLSREMKSGRERSQSPGTPPAPPAPAPLAPVGTGSAQPVVGFRSGMPLSDYEQMRLKERNGRP